jgi:hypothetical protein
MFFQGGQIAGVNHINHTWWRKNIYHLQVTPVPRLSPHTIFPFALRPRKSPRRIFHHVFGLIHPNAMLPNVLLIIIVPSEFEVQGINYIT